jgi:hypothetical protein
VKFRTWLDAARLLLLLVCHVGIASSFVIWNPTIPCLDDSESSNYDSDLLILTDIQAPHSRHVCQLLNVYIIMASWVPPFLREFNGFECSITPDISKVILYGIGLATYAWRYATRPKQIMADDLKETGWVQPSSLSDPVTEPWDSSVRHLSELMSPSTSVRDSRRKSGRGSRLEKQRLF